MAEPAFREARVEDAPVLCAAEVEIARTPGFLVSLPRELKVESFAARIAELRGKGLYLVAELEGKPVAHAILEPMPLERLAHVFRLTIVVHSGYQRRGLGALLMKELRDWAQAAPKVGK